MGRQFRLRFVIPVLASVTLLSFPGCRKPAPLQEIRIGVIAYLRGDSVEVEGKSTVNAASMAVDEVNADGGLLVGDLRHKVTLVVEGTNSIPEETVAAASKLINQENVVAIVGPQFSSDAIPTGGVAETARIPLISPTSSNPKTTAGRRYVFRMGFVDDFQGKAMALFARRELGARSAAILFNVANPYSRDIAAVFKGVFVGAGGRVPAFLSYTTDEKDYTRQLREVHKAGVDVLFLPNFSEDVKAQASQARSLGITASLLGADAWDRREFQGLPEFDGAFMSTTWSRDLTTAGNLRFVAEYTRRFGREPGDTAALTYDAFGILFEAIRSQRKFDPQSIRDGLYRLPPYSGIGGSVDFVDNGDPVKSVVILRFAGGRAVFHRLVTP